MADWLRDTTWEVIGAKIPVVKDFRYLGVHINTVAVRRASTLDKRIERAIAMLRRLKHLPMGMAAKAKTIRTVVYPGGLYGIEVAQTTRTKIAALAAAVKDVVHTRQKPPRYGVGIR